MAEASKIGRGVPSSPVMLENGRNRRFFLGSALNDKTSLYKEVLCF